MQIYFFFIYCIFNIFQPMRHVLHGSIVAITVYVFPRQVYVTRGTIVKTGLMKMLNTAVSVYSTKKDKITDVRLTFNSLAPGRCGSNSKSIIFKLIIRNNNFCTHCEIALKWMPHNLTDDKSTLTWVMVWCHQATSHYLSQCWPRPMSPYGVTRPRSVNSLAFGRCGCNFDVESS